MSKIYLDHNATTPAKPQVIEKFNETLQTPGNASSVHYFGRLAKKNIEHARKQVAQAVGTKESNVVFTSGATESNNTVLKAFDSEKIWVGSTEHSSISVTLPNATRIPVLETGIIDLEWLEKSLKENQNKPELISIALVNSETGVIQPMKKIAEICLKHGIFVHSDATQALGKIPINVKDLKIDFMSLAAHKMGGMQGCGALILHTDCKITPYLTGGAQESLRRAGTENIAGISAFGLACELAIQDMNKYHELEELRDHLQINMIKICPSMVVMGENAPRVANTLNVSWPGQAASMLLMNCDLEGVAISTGSACSSGSMKPSPVLTAMGMDENIVKGAMRISLGWNTTKSEIQTFIKIWEKIVARVN